MANNKIQFVSYIKKKTMMEILRENYEEKINKDILPKYKNYYLIYVVGYNPPLWVGNKKYQDYVWRYGSETIVYYDKQYNLDDIKKLAKEREPTNITLTRIYSQNLLKEAYGYEICPYNEIFHPNIAIYCHTPICMTADMTPNYTPKYIHVLSVYGLAFDSEEQPDYKRYMTIAENKRAEEFKKEMTCMFNKIVHCFKTKKFKYLLMHGVGMGVFNTFAMNLGIHSVDIFIGCCVEHLGPLFNDNDTKTLYLNFPPPKKGVPMITQEIINIKFSEHKNIHYKGRNFPDIIGDFSNGELSDMLVINAWDPFSVVGNGNAGDISLDGFIGKHTAAGILSWPIFNEKIKYEAL